MDLQNIFFLPHRVCRDRLLDLYRELGGFLVQILHKWCLKGTSTNKPVYTCGNACLQLFSFGHGDDVTSGQILHLFSPPKFFLVLELLSLAWDFKMNVNSNICNLVQKSLSRVGLLGVRGEKERCQRSTGPSFSPKKTMLRNAIGHGYSSSLRTHVTQELIPTWAEVSFAPAPKVPGMTQNHARKDICFQKVWPMPLLKSMICFSLVYRDSYSTVGDLGHVLFLTIMVLPWY